jgi:peptidoglycan/xylan/chitin deacetylase (PgdA/CDA1 family)
MENTQPGSIILEHDGGGNRSQTVEALRVVLPRLLGEGYHFVTP